MIRRQFIISGKVQGVWFRAGTREYALVLGLSGYVANLADGSVQVQAQGCAEAISKLEQWLQHGPDLAKVMRLECVAIELIDTESEFRIL
jgi:acylphosphatase